MRLKYIGGRPVVFLTGGVGLVEPGGEFDVREDVAERFYQRPDIERADGKPKPPPKAKTKAKKARRGRRAAATDDEAADRGEHDAQDPADSPQDAQDATNETERGI